MPGTSLCPDNKGVNVTLSPLSQQRGRWVSKHNSAVCNDDYTSDLGHGLEEDLMTSGVSGDKDEARLRENVMQDVWYGFWLYI